MTSLRKKKGLEKIESLIFFLVFCCPLENCDGRGKVEIKAKKIKIKRWATAAVPCASWRTRTPDGRTGWHQADMQCAGANGRRERGDARDAKTESAARRLGLREAGTAAIIADRLRRVRQSRGLSPSGGGQTTCVTEQRTTSLTWNGWLGGQLQLRTQTKQTREETKKKKNKKKSGNFQVPWPVPAGPSGQKGRRTGIRLPSELCVCVCVRLSLSPSECVSYSVVSPRLSVC